MYSDVVFVEPRENYQLYLEIKDGRKGFFDMSGYLNFGVFNELKELHYFNQVFILYGAVTWPHDQDIAPERLLSEMKFIL